MFLENNYSPLTKGLGKMCILVVVVVGYDDVVEEEDVRQANLPVRQSGCYYSRG